MVTAFVDWVQSINPIWGVILLTVMPIFELRASIPFGLLATALPTWAVIVTAVITNWLIAPVVYFILKQFLNLIKY